MRRPYWALKFPVEATAKKRRPPWAISLPVSPFFVLRRSLLFAPPAPPEPFTFTGWFDPTVVGPYCVFKFGVKIKNNTSQDRTVSGTWRLAEGFGGKWIDGGFSASVPANGEITVAPFPTYVPSGPCRLQADSKDLATLTVNPSIKPELAVYGSIIKDEKGNCTASVDIENLTTETKTVGVYVALVRREDGARIGEGTTVPSIAPGTRVTAWSMGPISLSPGTYDLIVQGEVKATVTV
jgi:hypothetical protein